MLEQKVDFSSLPWESPLPKVRYKAFQQGCRQLRLVEFSKGFVEPDWCAKGHIGYLLEGVMDVDFDGRVVRFSAGDGVFIPAGEETRHKATIVTDTVKVILVEDVD